MGVAQRWIVLTTNDNVNEINFAEFGIELQDGNAVSNEQTAVQIIAYTAVVGAEVMADGTRLAGLKLREAGENVSIDYPFPVDAYDTFQTANVANYPGMVAMAAYGEVIGDPGAGLAPLGTSAVITEYSAIGGPAGRGRHYLPFIGGTCITPGGYLDPTIRATLELAYNNLILGLDLSPIPVGADPLMPVIENSAGTVAQTVTGVKAQPVFSNLKSRRR